MMQLVKNKTLKVRMENGEESYSFTEEGLKKTREMIKSNEEMQLLLFTLIFNTESKRRVFTDKTDKHSAVKFALRWMIDHFGEQFLDVFEKACKEGKFSEG